MAGFTNADIEAVERSIARGVTRVSHPDGRSIEYQSMDKLLALRDRMIREVGARTGTPRTYSRPAVFNRG